jgi:hypothetical protein
MLFSTSWKLQLSIWRTPPSLCQPLVCHMPDMQRARGATISVEPFEISLPRGTQLRNVILWYGIGVLALAAFAVGDASLVRTYRDAALIEISADGRLMLARSSARKVNNCPDQRPSCSADVLQAYETGTGESLGQLISRGGFHFGLARFSNDHLVAGVEQDWKSNPVRIEWDPVSGRRSEASFTFPKGGQLICALNGGGLLLGIADQSVMPSLFRLAVANAESVERLQQPDLAFVQNGAPDDRWASPRDSRR